MGTSAVEWRCSINKRQRRVLSRHFRRRQISWALWPSKRSVDWRETTELFCCKLIRIASSLHFIGQKQYVRFIISLICPRKSLRAGDDKFKLLSCSTREGRFELSIAFDRNEIILLKYRRHFSTCIFVICNFSKYGSIIPRDLAIQELLHHCSVSILDIPVTYTILMKEFFTANCRSPSLYFTILSFIVQR